MPLQRPSRRPFFLDLAALACLWLAACGNAEPRLEPLAGDAVILAFGDSLTHGTGAGRSEDYPSRLAELTGRTVINAGEPGELSGEGRERLPALLDKHDPDLVILWHGGNDILRDRDPAETEQNLRAMVNTSRESGAQVLLLAVPARSLFLGTAEFYSSVAKDLDVPLIDELLADVLRDRELKADPIHPNGKGYKVIAEKVRDVIR